MTDFATEILPEEEEKAEEQLPLQANTAQAPHALATPAGAEQKAGAMPTDVGNAALARELDSPKTGRPGNTNTATVKPKQPRNTKQAVPDTQLKQETGQPSTHSAADAPTEPIQGKRETESSEANRRIDHTATKVDPGTDPIVDPIAQQQFRAKLLSLALYQLYRAPETIAVEVLFSAFLNAPKVELSHAALAIANAVLRLDVDARRRARTVLSNAVTDFKGHALAQILVLRLGAWVSTRPPPPRPPEPVEDP